MQFCSNCQKQLSSDRFDLHLGYCRRNIKKCTECQKPYDINNLQQHMEQFHNFQKCQYCNIDIRSRQIAAHRKACPHQPINCFYCQMNIPNQIYEDHKKNCQSRTKKCQKCQQFVKNVQYLNHITDCQANVSASNNSSSQFTRNPFTSYTPSSSNHTSYYQYSPSYTSYSPSSYSFSSQSNPLAQGQQPTIRTYTRTYIPSSPHLIRSTSGTTSNNSQNNGQSNYQTYTSSSGNVISRRVVSTRVIVHDGNRPNERNETTSYQPVYNSSPVTYYSSNSQAYGVQNSSNLTDEDPQLQAALLASLQYENFSGTEKK